VLDGVPSCGALFSRAQAVLCMAGYNSTLEALAAGRRPILVPRRSPRREQAIRAGRLAALGLADVVDEGADAEEVSWLLDRDRRLTPTQLREAGVTLDGARRAAQVLVQLAMTRSFR
jgi:predicted glycosyltransferase